MIRFVVNSHVDYNEATLPVIIHSLVETNQIPPDDILIVSGGSSVATDEMYDGVRHLKTTHNSFDHTALIELVLQPIEHPYWFVLHDTCMAGEGFYQAVCGYSKEYDFVSVHPAGYLNMGCFTWGFLQENKNYILSMKNCTKRRAMLSERLYMRMGRSTCYGDKITYLGKNDVYKQGVPRHVHYFDKVCLYKYQANTRPGLDITKP